MKKNNCPNCGAPITTEVCPYCNVFTGLKSSDANMEYPVIECKEAHVGFWNVIFPMIFAFGFGFPIWFLPMIIMASDFEERIYALLMFTPFVLIGIVAFVIGIRPVIRYFSIKKKGRDITGTVYGYMDDNILINGNPSQIVKILVNTNDGKKFILYQLGDVKQPYKINSDIRLKVYKDTFMIDKNKEYYF